MRKLLLALVAFVGITSSASAQYRCGTDVMNNRQRARNPFLIQAQANYEQMMREEMLEFRQNRDGETDAILVIPVVFHVLHMNGPENISDAQILNQMQILNRDYNKLNADTIEVVQGFDTIIANVKLEFRLATKDPLGNCTNGIERIYTIETYVGDNGSKLNQWPRERYLNVWTVADMENGVAGYSQYPSAVIDEMSARADGVIIRHDYIGNIGTSAEYSSRALTHEIGHWLDLAHPWGSTNDPEVECGDDGVNDTPVTEGHASCTNLKDYSCNSTNTSNLRYSFDEVVSGFTGIIDPTTPPAGYSGEETFARMVFSPFTASGVFTNPVADSSFTYAGWTTGAPDQTTSINDCTGALSTTDYYEFTVTPRPGSAMTITEITFKVNRSATGPRTYAVRSSINGFANNLTAGISPANTNLTLLSAPNLNTFFINTDTTSIQNGSKITLTGANYTSVITPITFRIYGWNAEDAFGSFGVDDVLVAGNYGAIENVQNYMDYSYCSHMFTEGQKQRMRLALASALSGRNQLYTAENRALTGTDDNPLSCAPEANFYPSTKFACIGDNITFRDNSTNGTVETWSWTFEDGTPATSNAQNPVVSFNSYGRKTVTLTVLNANGSTTKTIEQCVVIGTDGNEYPGALLQENFDSYNEFYNRWYGENHDNNMSVWQQTSQAGFSNNTSAKLNAFDMGVSFIDEGGQDIDELASGVMDLSDVASGAVVTFKWAFATQSTDLAGITDALEVYVSNDCGRTWSASPRLTIEGTDLVTAGSVSTSFVPSGSADWEEGSFTVPNSYYNDGFRMKFVFLAGDYPNNLYIDDINMTAVVNVEEQIAENFSAVLYPNPTTSTTTLSYINAGNQQMNIQLMDLSGRVVRSWNPMNQSNGLQQLVIDTEDLSKGVYMLNLRSDNTTSTLKLMVK